MILMEVNNVLSNLEKNVLASANVIPKYFLIKSFYMINILEGLEVVWYLLTKLISNECTIATVLKIVTPQFFFRSLSSLNINFRFKKMMKKNKETESYLSS